MKKLCFVPVVVMIFAADLNAATYYISPAGNDSYSGTEASPFFTLNQAASVVSPGDTIFVRGGTYFYTNTMLLDKPGTADACINIFACTNEHPVLDFTNQPNNFTATDANNNNRGIYLTTNANFWHIKGLEICWAGDNGMKLEGSCDIIEQCVFHNNGDTGLQIGFGHPFVNPGNLGASNAVINCDSYLNFDFETRGGNADGFACKMHPGYGNIFMGCRSWWNADDGWDFFESDHQIIVSNCWTWHSGDKNLYTNLYQLKAGKAMSSFGGNGNGFKMGGDGSGGDSKGTHLAVRCVAFGNHYPNTTGTGFTDNSHADGEILINCTSFSNHYNFFFEQAVNSGKFDEFVNDVNFGNMGTAGISLDAGTMLETNNTWNLTNITASTNDFVDLSETAASAPRQTDGSLPDNGFARLVAGSDLIDAGVNVGLPFNGSAPDLGAFEFGTNPIAQTPSVFDPSGCVKTNGGFRVSLGGLTGHGPVIIYASSNLSNWTAIFTNAATTNTMQFLDAAATNKPQRFYRALEQ